MLASLVPCPALLIDRHWTLLAANRALGLLLAGVDAELLRPPVNALRVSLHPRGMAPRIANLAEWRGHVLHRVRRDAEAAADPVLSALHDELRAYPAEGLHRAPEPGAGPHRRRARHRVLSPRRRADRRRPPPHRPSRSARVRHLRRLKPVP